MSTVNTPTTLQEKVIAEGKESARVLCYIVILLGGVTFATWVYSGFDSSSLLKISQVTGSIAALLGALKILQTTCTIGNMCYHAYKEPKLIASDSPARIASPHDTPHDNFERTGKRFVNLDDSTVL